MQGSPALAVLAVGVLGIAGTVLLLVLAWNMLRDERARRASRPPAGAPGVAGPLAASALEEAASAAPSLTAPAPEAAPPAAPSIPSAPLAPAPPATAAPAPSASLPAEEILRVLREPASGQLVVELGGQRFSRASQVRQANQQADLAAVLRELLPLAGIEAGSLASGPAYTPPAPSMNPFRQMQVLREMQRRPPTTARSIPEQIDELLQARLEGTALEARGLHVQADARGAVMFTLDGQGYAGVDEVPDPGARQLIRAATAEWEARQ